MKLKLSVLTTLLSLTSLAQIQHSVSVTGGFAFTGSGDMYGTVVEGAYSYYFNRWSITGQIGRADFSGRFGNVVQEPGLGLVDFVPASRLTNYRTADLLFGYSTRLGNSRMNFITRGGASMARISSYFIGPMWGNNDYDVLDLGYLLEVGLGYEVIRTGNASIDLNLKASGRNYINTNDGYVRLSVGLTCRLYEKPEDLLSSANQEL